MIEDNGDFRYIPEILLEKQVGALKLELNLILLCKLNFNIEIKEKNFYIILLYFSEVDMLSLSVKYITSHPSFLNLTKTYSPFYFLFGQWKLIDEKNYDVQKQMEKIFFPFDITGVKSSWVYCERTRAVFEPTPSSHPRLTIFRQLWHPGGENASGATHLTSDRTLMGHIPGKFFCLSHSLMSDSWKIIFTKNSYNYFPMYKSK